MNFKNTKDIYKEGSGFKYFLLCLLMLAGCASAKKYPWTLTEADSVYENTSEDISTGDAQVLPYDWHQNIRTNLTVCIVQLKIFPEHGA